MRSTASADAMTVAYRPAVVADPEEARWVARAREGDEAAYAWLLAAHRARAVRLASHVLRRPDEAEDVAQEAFLKAFRRLNEFRGEGGFYSWLYPIVVRTCLDRRRLFRWVREAFGLEAVPPRLAQQPPDEEALDRVLVGALLDRLPMQARIVLVLRELEGLEYEEIAAALQVPIGTVRSRLNTARMRFRKLWLEEHGEVDG